jgi:hypothetical protein
MGVFFSGKYTAQVWCIRSFHNRLLPRKLCDGH